MRVFIVGKNTSRIFNRGAWEFQGVFTDEAVAVSKCTTPRHFVGPAIMDEMLPDETIQWTDAYYPFAAPAIGHTGLK